MNTLKPLTEQEFKTAISHLSGIMSMKVNRALDVRAHMFWEVSDQNGAAYLGCSRSINAEFRNAVCDAMGEWSDVSTALHRAYVERFVPEVPSESSLD